MLCDLDDRIRAPCAPSQRSRPTSLTPLLSPPQLKRTDKVDGKPWFDEASQTIDPVRDAHIDGFFRRLGGRLRNFSVAMHARARRRHRSSRGARRRSRESPPPPQIYAVYMNILIGEVATHQLRDADQCRPCIAGTEAVGNAFRLSGYSIEAPEEHGYSIASGGRGGFVAGGSRHPLIACDGFWEPRHPLPWDREANYDHRDCALLKAPPPHVHVYQEGEPLLGALEESTSTVVRLPKAFMKEVRGTRSKIQVKATLAGAMTNLRTENAEGVKGKARR